MTGQEETGFRALMQDRLRRWYHDAPATEPTPEASRRRAYVAGLVHKTRLYDHARESGLPVPARLADVARVTDLDFAALPDRVVIKPDNSAACDAVMLLADGRDYMTGAAVARSDWPAYVATRIAAARHTSGTPRILAEEFLRDVDPAYPMPRDFKFYVAGGRAHLLSVVDRNAGPDSWSSSHYDRDWNPLPWRIQGLRAAGPAMPRPQGYEALLALTDRIAGDLNCFMRLDFYLTDRGPVLGELTSYPGAGLHFSPDGDRFLCELMARYPDFV